MRIVVALGGNALLRRGEKPDARIQRAHIDDAAAALAPLVTDHELIVCHGNGPQVGLLARESSVDDTLTEPYPLDALGAQTQGMIGYWLSQSLRNHGVRQSIAVVVTQTVVDADDPAFVRPSKFIGPVYTDDEARPIVARFGWEMSGDGSARRRVVASPVPKRLVERHAIEALVRTGVLVICGGGGGAPVVEEPSGRLRGIDAVVDKDHVAAMVARDLDADRLLVLTDVPGVVRDFGSPFASVVDRILVEDLTAHTFAAGSMGPKVEACSQFVGATGKLAHIGALEDAADIIGGRAGTTIYGRPYSERKFRASHRPHEEQV